MRLNSVLADSTQIQNVAQEIESITIPKIYFIHNYFLTLSEQIYLPKYFILPMNMKSLCFSWRHLSRIRNYRITLHDVLSSSFIMQHMSWDLQYVLSEYAVTLINLAVFALHWYLKLCVFKWRIVDSFLPRTACVLMSLVKPTFNLPLISSYFISSGQLGFIWIINVFFFSRILSSWGYFSAMSLES